MPHSPSAVSPRHASDHRDQEKQVIESEGITMNQIVVGLDLSASAQVDTEKGASGSGHGVRTPERTSSSRIPAGSVDYGRTT